jgi:hypothetical protein
MPSRKAARAGLPFGPALFFVLLVQSLGAQPVERRTAEQLAVAERQCSSAAEALARSAISEVSAMWTFVACGNSGAGFLAARWSGPMEDSAVVNALVFNSRRMHDARVSEAALAALQNRANPLEIRIAALEVIIAHIEPDLWVEFGPIGTLVFQPLPGDTARARSAEHVPFSAGRPPMMLTRGGIPVTEATRQRLKQALRVLSRGPDDHYLLLAIAALPRLVDAQK